MKTFRIRASAGGKLMTAPRSKSETLSQTTKSHLQEWAKEQIYGVRKEIKSKYLTKGITQEDAGIDKTIEWLDLPFVIKNEKYFEDDYFCGTPDLIIDELDEVIDTKLSWDCYTFPLFDEVCPNKDYEIQLQIYMHLTGKKKARLVYILLNTPENLTYETPHNYDAIDKKYRIKTYSFDYDPAIIETLKDKVLESRKYLDNLCIFTKEIRQD